MKVGSSTGGGDLAGSCLNSSMLHRNERFVMMMELKSQLWLCFVAFWVLVEDLKVDAIRILYAFPM